MGLRRKRKVDIKSLSVDGTNIDDSIAELAALDGLTATVAELNLLDTAEAGTAVASKALALGANKNVDELHLAALYLGAGAGTQMTATAAELNRNASVTPGTAAANKTAVLGASKDLDVLVVNALTATIATPITVATPMTTTLMVIGAATPPVSAATPTSQAWATKSLIVTIGGAYYGIPLFTVATPW